MRVIFLDFDGVLNSESDDDDNPGEYWTSAWLDLALVTRLAQLVARADAKVVVSSSWRQRRSLDELAEMLAERGYSAGIFDVTPRLPRPPQGDTFVRSLEIEEWLTAHPEVTAYVILDDDREMGALADRHVQTDPKRGLTDDDVERALELLGV